jgi:hypothetical protein
VSPKDIQKITSADCKRFNKNERETYQAWLKVNVANKQVEKINKDSLFPHENSIDYQDPDAIMKLCNFPEELPPKKITRFTSLDARLLKEI